MTKVLEWASAPSPSPHHYNYKSVRKGECSLSSPKLLKYEKGIVLLLFLTNINEV